MARILLTEDDEAVRAFVKRALELDGHQVVTAEDGGIALEILTAEHGSFDLVFYGQDGKPGGEGYGADVGNWQ